MLFEKLERLDLGVKGWGKLCSRQRHDLHPGCLKLFC